MKRPWLWIVVVASLTGVIVLTFVRPSAMVSPGPLVPAHAELARDCFACHAPFRGAASDKCIGCHVVANIGVRTTGGALIERTTKPAIRTSFHQDLSEQNCSACHSEHQRRIERPFAHDLLRPAMRGECATCHAAPSNELHRALSVSCNQCHTTAHWTPATFDHAALPSATLARCESCHSAPSDAFHKKIPGACSGCHTPPRWKPSTFNHDRFFVLDHDHDTSCATCHTTDDFTHYTCFGCHEHTAANVRAEHEEEGIFNLDDCVSCHRSAEGERGEGREHGQGRESEH